MPRILLADDSPHAQRMGERILEEEGYEVYTVNDGDAALISLAEVRPDLLLVDMFLPRRSGRELCRFLKTQERFRSLPVVLTVGAAETFDEQDLELTPPDAVLRKPFEASVVMRTIRPLLDRVSATSASAAEAASQPLAPVHPAPEPLEHSGAPVQVLTRELEEDEQLASHVRAAVTLALERLWPHIVDEVSSKVLVALKR